MNLKALLKQKLDAQAALVTTAITEGRGMTDDEQKQFDAYEAEIKNLEKTIAAEEEVKKKQQAIEDSNKPVNEPIFATPKNPDEKKWKGLGEYFTAIKNASTPGGNIDKRLFMDSATGNNTSLGVDGGFLVDKEFRTDLMDAMKEESQVAKDINMIPIGAASNGLKWVDIEETSRADGYRHGGALTYWVSEAETATASKIKVNKTEIELEKLLGFWYATSELLSDATAMEAMARMEFANAMSFVVDDAIINGNGVGKPLGILNSGALITVAKEPNQAAGTIVYKNIQKMWNVMSAKSRSRAVWYINQEVEPQLESMTMVAGTGEVLSPLAKEFIEKRTLYSRPVVAIEQASKLGDKGDIILADPKSYIGIDKNGMQADVSLHVKFLYDESCFRFIYRFNGAPRKSNSVASYKNANFKTSPFVTLAERK